MGHHVFEKAGVPYDRIDFILVKWLDAAFPEAVEANYGKSNIVVSGFTCDNGYGSDLNQEYVFQGVTKDGRPFYRGMARPDRYIYYDKHCADDTSEPRWLLGGKPDLNRDFDMNVMDGVGCDNDFSIVTDSKHVPAGVQKLAWNWCGDHGIHQDATVAITYAISEHMAIATPKDKQPFVDQCNKFDAYGPLVVRGCRACEKFYPWRVGACMACGKSCKSHCPSGSSPECYSGEEFTGCHTACMLKGGQKEGVKTNVDLKDCYFDEECHAKVDWDAVGKLKKDFFVRKWSQEQKTPDAEKLFMQFVHAGMAKVGMPEDRIDYVLEKWEAFAKDIKNDKTLANKDKSTFPLQKHEPVATQCGKYEHLGDIAVKGCHGCAKWYASRADDCMACGGSCQKHCPAGSDFECYKGQEFVACHKACMARPAVLV